MAHLKSLFTEFKKIGRVTFLAGLNNSHSGNMSYRISPDRALIKRHGAMMGFLEDKDIITIKLKGNDPNLRIASSEAEVHRAILNKTRHKAVLHTHPLAATTLAFFTTEIKPINLEATYYLKTIPVLVFKKPSASVEMAQGLARWLVKYKCVLVRGHGAFSVGATLEEALKYAHTLEDAARMLVIHQVLQPGY